MVGYVNGDSPYHPGKHLVTPSMAFYDVVGTSNGKFRGSYNVFACRLFGLSPAQYLRMVRDNYGATLTGKAGYITYYFDDRTQCNKLVKELNRRWVIMLKQLEESS